MNLLISNFNISIEFEYKMLEMQQSSSINDLEILKMVDTVKNSFKKSGVWSSKKPVNYVPQRLKEVVNNAYFSSRF